jgi:hypothetical protein
MRSVTSRPLSAGKPPLGGVARPLRLRLRRTPSESRSPNDRHRRIRYIDQDASIARALCSRMLKFDYVHDFHQPSARFGLVASEEDSARMTEPRTADFLNARQESLVVFRIERHENRAHVVSHYSNERIGRCSDSGIANKLYAVASLAKELNSRLRHILVDE